MRDLPPGVPLKEEDLEQGKVLLTLYHPRVKYSWATGVAIGRFLAGLKAGTIVGTQCDRCGRIVVPPRIFCEQCFRKTDHWVNLPDTGSVNTFSVSYISTDTTRLKTPIVPAVIEIDETSGAGFLHLLAEVKPEDIRIGMRVKAVWKDVEARSGAITDIKHFKPVGR